MRRDGVWDTSTVPLHLWGMVAELTTSRMIPAQTVADAAGGDALAVATIVRAHHHDMAPGCPLICRDPAPASPASWPGSARRSTMTDFLFDNRLERAARRYANEAVRPIDAVAIAESAIRAGRRDNDARRFELRLPRSWAAAAVAGVAIAVVVGGSL